MYLYYSTYFIIYIRNNLDIMHKDKTPASKSIKKLRYLMKKRHAYPSVSQNFQNVNINLFRLRQIKPEKSVKEDLAN